MGLIDHILPALRREMDVLAESFKDELKQQGHYNTGQLDKSVRTSVTVVGGKVVGQIFAGGTIDFLEDGTRHKRVTRKQISGLTDWLKHKGFNDKKAKSVAWAIAVTQVKEGSPTRGAFEYSHNGRRTGAIKYGIAARRADFLIKLNFKQGVTYAIKDTLQK